MAGYVLTIWMLNLARQVCKDARQLYLGCEVSGDVSEFEALNRLSAALDLADGLDADDIREVATWARERARASGAGLAPDEIAKAESCDKVNGTDFAATKRRRIAECSRIDQLCSDILEALAESKLQHGAVRVLGREEPTAEALAASLTVPIGRGGPAEFEQAANTKMSRPQIEGLPSADRVALGQILATLRGEARTAKPHEGAAVDVLVELDVYLRKLANVDQRREYMGAIAVALGLGIDAEPSDIVHQARIAGDALTDTAPVYNLPDSHPLRCYRWGDWLDALLRREEVGASSGCWRPDVKRVEALRTARERVAMRDVDGLLGLCSRFDRLRQRGGGSDVLTSDEIALLFRASGDDRLLSQGQHGQPIRLGSNVVPAVPRVGGGG